MRTDSISAGIVESFSREITFNLTCFYFHYIPIQKAIIHPYKYNHYIEVTTMSRYCDSLSFFFFNFYRTLKIRLNGLSNGKNRTELIKYV